MGCHTWFYRKIERTQQEANESCIKGLKKSRRLSWKIFKNPTSYRGINWEEDCGSTKESCLNSIKIINRKIKAIYNGYYQRAIWNHQQDEELTHYIDNKGLYIEDTGFYNVFRRGGYPEDRLFSYEETIKYLEDNDSIITYGYFQRSHRDIPCINGLCNGEKPTWFEVDREPRKLEALKLLKEFWDKYPDGMIEFG